MTANWHDLFVPSGSLLEIFLRGSAIYLALFLAMRFLPRRTVGAMGPSDILVVVLIADAVQQGMAGDYRSITEAILLAMVIIGWAQLIDWLDFRFPALHIAEAKPLQLVARGRLLHANLRRQNITEEELLSQLRQHGLDSPARVESAFVEGDGHLSVIVRSHEPLDPPARKTL